MRGSPAPTPLSTPPWLRCLTREFSSFYFEMRCLTVTFCPPSLCFLFQMVRFRVNPNPLFILCFHFFQMRGSPAPIRLSTPPWPHLIRIPHFVGWTLFGNNWHRMFLPFAILLDAWLSCADPTLYATLTSMLGLTLNHWKQSFLPTVSLLLFWGRSVILVRRFDSLRHPDLISWSEFPISSG